MRRGWIFIWARVGFLFETANSILDPGREKTLLDPPPAGPAKKYILDPGRPAREKINPGPLEPQIAGFEAAGPIEDGFLFGW